MPHAFLSRSDLFQNLRKAFEDASNLPLVLEPAEVERWTACAHSANQNEFCRLINPEISLIKPCQNSQWELSDLAKLKRTATSTCFAGMSETAIVIRYRGRVVSYLKTGQVFLKEPPIKIVQHLADIWDEFAETTNCDDFLVLKQSFLKTSRYSKSRYEGTIAFLNLIALQLESWLEANFEVADALEPEMVHKAKAFIDQHFADDLSLDLIAQRSGVSPFYLCRQFKDVTGQTLTEYIGQRRIEASKVALSRKHARIGEVALEVGFQSLSQFNRTFSKFCGQTPSEYRKQTFASPNVNV